MTTGLAPVKLQKTKIPARGLKLAVDVVMGEATAATPSKNQNPREGIETNRLINAIVEACNELQKTKIPARGLKLTRSDGIGTSR